MKKTTTTAAAAIILGLSLSACSSVVNQEPILVGEFTSISALDPAAVYGTTNFEVLYQVFPTLLNSMPGSVELENDIAETAEFTSPNVYSVTLKPGLSFANGNKLTASDAAFSLNRQLAIADEFGPSVLLANLDKAVAKSELQVDFYLKSENDLTFPYVLSSVPGLIVDEETFSANRTLSNDEVLEANAWAGPYIIEDFKLNEFISYKPNSVYKGLWGAPKNSGVIVKYYADAKNLAFDAKNGALDIAVSYRSMAGEEISSIVESSDSYLAIGDAAEPGYLVFNLDGMPFGTKSSNPNPEKALAVRKALATLIDREEISQKVYAGTYSPSYSPIPSAFDVHNGEYMSQYSAGSMEEKNAKAKAILVAAGIKDSISIDLVYPFDRYGPSTEGAMTLLKSQFETSGLFEMNLQATDWTSFREIRRSDKFQMIMIFWGPDFGDPDNYISPLFVTDGFLFNHYSNPAVDSAIKAQSKETNEAKRAGLFDSIQAQLAADLPVIPFLETGRSAIVKKGISGVQETIDASHKFKYFNFTRD